MKNLLDFSLFAKCDGVSLMDNYIMYIDNKEVFKCLLNMYIDQLEDDDIMKKYRDVFNICSTDEIRSNFVGVYIELNIDEYKLDDIMVAYVEITVYVEDTNKVSTYFEASYYDSTKSEEEYEEQWNDYTGGYDAVVTSDDIDGVNQTVEIKNENFLYLFEVVHDIIINNFKLIDKYYDENVA